MGLADAAHRVPLTRVVEQRPVELLKELQMIFQNPDSTLNPKRTVGEPAPASRLTGDQIADWVVVGAGVTGLAAARRLGELAPDARVLLLDEYRVGYGASGRNSGFIIDTPHLSEHLSEEDNRRVSRLILAGLADLKSHVEEHGIDCEWSPRGHLTAVVNAQREKKLHATGLDFYGATCSR